jgi:hypothetical protein
LPEKSYLRTAISEGCASLGRAKKSRSPWQMACLHDERRIRREPDSIRCTVNKNLGSHCLTVAIVKAKYLGQTGVRQKSRFTSKTRLRAR